MAETIENLEEQLKHLRHSRSRSAKSVAIEGQEVQFRSDRELASAVAEVERRINQLKNGRITTIRLSSSKGL